MKNFLFTFSTSLLFISSFYSQTVTEKEFLNANYKTCDSIIAKYYRIIESNRTLNNISTITYFNIAGIKRSQGEYIYDKEWKNHGFLNYYDTIGNKTELYNYINDILNGYYYSYFENGEIKLKGEYLDDEYNDSLLTYYQSGSIRRLDLYDKGEFISGKCYTSNGQDTLYFPLEKEAEFLGGFSEMSKFISENIIYPKSAIISNAQGKCYLKFKINKQGKIGNITIVRGVPGCPECDYEARRVIKNMPNWIPSEFDGYTMDSWFQIPINFTLERGRIRNRKRG